MSRAVLTLAVVAFTLGCGDSQGPSFPANWVGDMGSQLLTMEIALDGQDVAGTGALVHLASTSSIALEVAGTFQSPAIALTFTGSPFGTMTFAGSYVSGGSLAGTLNGGGFTDRTVTFRSR